MSIHLQYETARRWARFARQAGARFDVEQKAVAALAASLGSGRFALPSKLVATKPHGARLRALAGLLGQRGPVRLALTVEHGDDGQPVVVASCPALRTGEGSAVAVGQVQPKHLPWLLPLVEARAVRCYATAVTGGTPRRPTRGCNSLPRTSVGVAFTFHTSGRQSAARL